MTYMTMSTKSLPSDAHAHRYQTKARARARAYIGAKQNLKINSDKMEEERKARILNEHKNRIKKTRESSIRELAQSSLQTRNDPLYEQQRFPEEEKKIENDNFLVTSTSNSQKNTTASHKKNVHDELKSSAPALPPRSPTVPFKVQKVTEYERIQRHFSILYNTSSRSRMKKLQNSLIEEQRLEKMRREREKREEKERIERELR